MRAMIDSFNPPDIWQPFGAFAMAAIQGDGQVVHLKGQVALDRDNRVVGVGDMRAQTRQVLENIRTVLASAGGTMADIAKVTVFVTDMAGLAEIHQVRAEFFTPPYPASSLVQVARLVKPEYLIEIEAVAVIPPERVKRAD